MTSEERINGLYFDAGVMCERFMRNGYLEFIPLCSYGFQEVTNEVIKKFLDSKWNIEYSGNQLVNFTLMLEHEIFKTINPYIRFTEAGLEHYEWTMGRYRKQYKDTNKPYPDDLYIPDEILE